MNRNLKYLPYILPLYFAWFWLGIWLPYYLRVTDYAGIGILEASMFFVGVVLEIPTGAISDMIGKKKTLITAFLLFATGNFVMAMSDEYSTLFLSVFIMIIGGALLSGTSEAIVYDSAKSIGLEDKYEEYLSKVEKFSLIFLSISSFAGGLLYSVNIRLPFIATGIMALLGATLLFFLIKEPPIDTEKFSFKNYINQNKEGIKSFLSIPKPNLFFVFLILVIFSLSNIIDQIVDTAYAIELGYNEVQLGILFGFLPLIGAIAAEIYPKFVDRLGKSILMVIVSLLFLGSLLIAPVIGFLLGTSMIALRTFLEPIMKIMSSNEINRNVDSKYRATTISVFQMIKQLPYIVVAYFLGSSIDTLGATNVVFGLGIVFTIIYIVVNFSHTLVIKNKV